MARLVLVHGAFAGAWCWERVAGPLREGGHDVEALDMPGAGEDPTPIEGATLDSYADRICAALEAAERPAILVGHSMGGVAITQAAARCRERVAALVYVAAFLPADGQSLVALTELPEGAGDGVQANIVVEGEPPAATLPDEAAGDVLFGRATRRTRRGAWPASGRSRSPRS